MAAPGSTCIGLDLVDAAGRPAPDDAQVSSTAIRSALAAGDLATANRTARAVLRGARRSSNTATIEASHSGSRPPTSRSRKRSCCPPTASTPRGTSAHPVRWFPAAASLGRRPTFYESQPYRLLEVHLLDWDGDLYGEEAKVSFVARLREEMKFDSRRRAGRPDAPRLRGRATAFSSSNRPGCAA